jgi:hypothetical protein
VEPAPVYVLPAPAPPKVSRFGLIFGAHIGASGISGVVAGAPPATGSVPIGDLAGGGLAFGLEAGFRFARHWIVGFEFEHDVYESGDQNHLANDFPSDGFFGPGATSHTYSTLAQVTIAAVVNPDRVSFYGDLGIGVRWLTYSVYDASSNFLSGASQSNAEFGLGVGIWIPIGRSFRLLPRLSLDIGTYSSEPDLLGNTTDYWHVAVMGGITGLYNLNF